MTTNIYRALSDPTRRQILSLLAAGELTQSEIVEKFEISQPAINKQLRILKEEGLLHEKRSGRYRLYSLNTPVLATGYRTVVDEIGTMLDKSLHGLKHYVENKEDDGD